MRLEPTHVKCYTPAPRRDNFVGYKILRSDLLSEETLKKYGPLAYAVYPTLSSIPGNELHMYRMIRDLSGVSVLVIKPSLEKYFKKHVPTYQSVYEKLKSSLYKIYLGNKVFGKQSYLESLLKLDLQPEIKVALKSLLRLAPYHSYDWRPDIINNYTAPIPLKYRLALQVYELLYKRYPILKAFNGDMGITEEEFNENIKMTDSINSSSLIEEAFSLIKSLTQPLTLAAFRNWSL